MKFFLALLASLMAAPALAQTAAPAQATPARPLDPALLNLYVGPANDTLTDLNKAHRSEREIADWVSDIVATSLQFQAGQTNTKLLAVKPNFTDSGYKAYLTFLGSQPFAAALRDQTLSLNSAVNATPLLIGQGASGGRFAWAYEMPVIMTPKGQKSLKPVTVRIQIGRNAKGAAPHGVLIENWTVYQENVQNPDSGSQKP